MPAGDGMGWVCCVEQGHYGHRARKATWLYAKGVELPELIWGKSEGKIRLDQGHHSREERIMRGEMHPRITAKECLATPLEFAELLLSIARTGPSCARRFAEPCMLIRLTHLRNVVGLGLDEQLFQRRENA